MNGWKYEWVDELPIEVRDILLEEALKEHEKEQPG